MLVLIIAFLVEKCYQIYIMVTTAQFIQTNCVVNHLSTDDLFDKYLLYIEKSAGNNQNIIVI